MSDGLASNPLFGHMIGQRMGQDALLDAQHNAIEAKRARDAVSDDLALENQRLANQTTATAVGLVMQLRKEVDELSQSDSDYITTLSGVRAVTRELLAELRKTDPNNPLLDKKNRDKVFDTAKSAQFEFHKGTTVKERDVNLQLYRDQAYGAPGSNKGGPEKANITPNQALRKMAEIPEDHVTDRDKFMGLISTLAFELEKHDPRAAILQDKAFVEVFEEHVLNEMAKQEQATKAAGQTKNGR